jgi:inner membrane protein YidH
MNDLQDAEARTHLANERTQLAWWRTGLTALAVAVAVGRVVPELGNSPSQWPYTVIGVGFALYGIALIGYGTVRAREVDAAVSRGGRIPIQGSFLAAMAAAGIVLAVATALLIIIE